MKETMFLFPGQGSQAVGMGKDLFDQSEFGRKTFRLADDVLGLPLSRICFEGPEETLKLTAHTQPALLTVSYILFHLLEREPEMAAGHSLGEYSALLCAGALRFEDAVRLVHKRGTYMQEAVPVGRGSMAALIGVDIARVKGVLAEFSEPDRVVDLANWNSAGQIVISGDKTTVEEAVTRIAAPKSVYLPVSAPFHSRLMRAAEEKLAVDLDRIEFGDLRFPVINNVDAKRVDSGADARDGLKRQVSRPVLWHPIMEKCLMEMKMKKFVEIGAGRVLAGILRKTAREAGVETAVFNVEKLEDVSRPEF